MWISKGAESIIADQRNTITDLRVTIARLYGERAQQEIENARLRSDLDWFKLRLNHVERERGQLIQAAIGVKVSVPEFVPKMENPEEAFNALPDLSTIGGDANETWEDPTGVLAREEAADYSGLPGYRKHE